VVRPIIASCIIFALLLGGILLGTILRLNVPKSHLEEESRDVIRLSIGLIATIAALVLGLLIAAAKGSFDTQNGQVRQITANIILLDNLLAEYGLETLPIRANIRVTLPVYADVLWREKEMRQKTPFATNCAGERVYLDIQALSPKNDLQRSLQSRAIQAAHDLTQLRLLLFVESDNSIPAPFLAVLVIWLVIIFASFSLFATANATVFAIISLSAFSAAGAIFLVLELSQPFMGLMAISSEPLRNALAPLGR
jgi:hypothetical protein